MDSHTHDAAQRAANWLEANPDKHIEDTMARDHTGRGVCFDSPRAVCFCALGRFAYELIGGVEQDYGAFHITTKATGDAALVEGIVSMNDAGDHAGAIALLRTI